MAEQFEVKPDELRATAARLGELGSQANAVMSGAQAQIAGKGPVWGTGSLGSRFADGPDGFVESVGGGGGLGACQAKLLTDDAEKLKYAADVFQRSDDPV